jgi:hypothetical protein
VVCLVREYKLYVSAFTRKGFTELVTRYAKAAAVVGR